MDVRPRKGMSIAVAGAFFALLAAPAIAPGATRYAEPGGNGPAGANGCQAANPCGLEAAIENAAAADGDRILLLAGTYNIGAASLQVVDSITIEPAPGAGRPRITSTSPTFALAISTGADAAVVRGLEILALGTGGGLALVTGTAERMTVTSDNVACKLSDALLRDSVCLITSDSASSLSAVFVATAIAGAQPQLRNVTAISKNAGTPAIQVDADTNQNPKLFAHNVIASGFPDAEALEAPTNSSAEIVFSSSSFDTAQGVSGALVTPPGSGPGNITAPAQFVNFAADDFHQAAGSPTIDTGSPDPLLGGLDLDGVTRTRGAAPDMGAYESAPPADPPKKKCKRKKKGKKRPASTSKKKKKKKKGCLKRKKPRK